MEILKKVFFQNKQRIKTCILGITICFQITNIIAQNQISYEDLIFEQFLKTKLENDSNFVKIVYQNLNYSKEARERLAEEKIEIILQYEPNKKFRLIQINQNNHFFEQIQELEKLFNELKLKKTNPFITRFFIYFEINPFRYSEKDFENLYFGLIDNNTFVIRGYRVPEIKVHHREGKKNKN